MNIQNSQCFRVQHNWKLAMTFMQYNIYQVSNWNR